MPHHLVDFAAGY